MNIIIEPFVYPKHYRGLSTLFVKYGHETMKKDLEAVDNGVALVDKMITRYVEDGCRIAVALTSGDMIGFVFYKSGLKGSVVLVEELYVHPKHRGQNIAQSMLDALCHEQNDFEVEFLALYDCDNVPQGMIDAFDGFQNIRKLKSENRMLIRGSKNLSKIKIVENEVVS